jgi:hypothetical protein
MSAMWASKFLATFCEVGLYWQVKVFQIIFDVELRKLPVAVQARDSPCCHNVDPLDIPTNGSIVTCQWFPGKLAREI